MPSTARRHLNMTRDSVAMRQDLARSLRDLGMTFDEIGRQCGYVNAQGTVQESSVRGAIRASRNRAAAGQSSPVGAPSLSRRFGVEIECFGTTRARIHAALTEAGVVSEVESYGHTTRRHWKIITDASVNGAGTGEGGLEVVSPILEGDAGLRELRLVMRTLRAVGARIDRTCGMHVHHDANDLTPEIMARFVSSYVDNQRHIDRFVAPSRRTSMRGSYGTMGSRWCQMIPETEKQEILRRILGAGNLGGFDRYRTINVTSFPRYGTVEIRQHQGSLDGRKASAWVALGQALVRYAQNVTEPLVADDVDGLLTALQAHGGLTRSTANYLRNRAGVLASPVAA